jgi:hypothetical protein
MGATLTVTSEQKASRLTIYKMAWVSHTDGVVASLSTLVKPGYLVQLKVVPASGDDIPTDAYDLTLLDEDGCDLLGGAGANLNHDVGTHLKLERIWFNGGPVFPTIAAAGSGKKGTLVLVVE